MLEEMMTSIGSVNLPEDQATLDLYVADQILGNHLLPIF